MPTYEYVCKSCGHEFEVFQSMTENSKRKCPECGKNTLERKIGTGAAVLFKGSGFYQTDYRSESYKKAAESDKKPAEAKAETNAESKPDAKADTNAKPDKPEKAEKKPARKKSGASE